ncbi:N-lysine methyltransferase setd6 isoform X2 [Hippocampus comes]|uniref:N-lysine methyltransferase setd6 isoform X2 n=1 Tax=Hippocampus comes TaxID=109280 RepID=UPI00094EA10E|nr:PREDICTED: N-lysine methyltransferase SETD6 isoform X2 [Hippocampus comes]
MACEAKRPKVDNDASLQNFLRWCDCVNLVLSKKVQVCKGGVVADYGMVAQEDIGEGEVLFTIPRSALLHQGTTHVAALLEQEKDSLESTSGWVPLLLALLYEYTTTQSKWKPYLSLWTDFKMLDHPMFCFQEPQEEDDDEDDEEDPPNPPMMVPMADMLNHVSKHNANLEFTPDSLKMVCVRPIKKGEEVFNTYGQMANWQLLHMYGFTQTHSDNDADTADIPVINLYKAATKEPDGDQQLLAEMWELLRDKEAFVFGKDSCFTHTELHSVLKVLCMSREEFLEFKNNDGWEDDEDEDETIFQVFSNDGLLELKSKWRRLIHEAARLTVMGYPNLDEDRVLMEDQASLERLSRRQRNALKVRYGQKSILDKVMELTKS